MRIDLQALPERRIYSEKLDAHIRNGRREKANSETYVGVGIGSGSP
jgi:hypothetical protein